MFTPKHSSIIALRNASAKKARARNARKRHADRCDRRCMACSARQAEFAQTNKLAKHNLVNIKAQR